VWLCAHSPFRIPHSHSHNRKNQEGAHFVIFVIFFLPGPRDAAKHAIFSFFSAFRFTLL